MSCPPSLCPPSHLHLLSPRVLSSQPLPPSHLFRQSPLVRPSTLTTHTSLIVFLLVLLKLLLLLPLGQFIICEVSSSCPALCLERVLLRLLTLCLMGLFTGTSNIFLMRVQPDKLSPIYRRLLVSTNLLFLWLCLILLGERRDLSKGQCPQIAERQKQKESLMTEVQTCSAVQLLEPCSGFVRSSGLFELNCTWHVLTSLDSLKCPFSFSTLVLVSWLCHF